MIIYPANMISSNVHKILENIARSAERSGRPKDAVKLICVTKTVDTAAIEEALATGQRILGENRVQDAALKHSIIGGRASWHLIGHLQTNKARDAVKLFDLIHSVDSLKIANQIDKEANKIQKVQEILLQVNTSGESSKFGSSPAEVPEILKQVAGLQNTKVLGFMTMAPEVDNPETVRPYFRALKELRDKVNDAHIFPH